MVDAQFVDGAMDRRNVGRVVLDLFAPFDGHRPTGQQKRPAVAPAEGLDGIEQAGIGREHPAIDDAEDFARGVAAGSGLDHIPQQGILGREQVARKADRITKRHLDDLMDRLHRAFLRAPGCWRRGSGVFGGPEPAGSGGARGVSQ